MGEKLRAPRQSSRMNVLACKPREAVFMAFGRIFMPRDSGQASLICIQHFCNVIYFPSYLTKKTFVRA